jgi:ATP-binding cassette subfamily C protein CydC
VNATLNKRILALGLPRDGYFRFGLIVAGMQGLSAIALLGVSAWLISRAAEVSSIVFLGVAIVGVRGFAVGRATFRYGERLLLHESAFRMLGNLRPEIFSKLAPFIPAGMPSIGRGEVLTRIVSDVDELQNLSLRVVAPLVQSLVVASASILFVWLLLPAAGMGLMFAVLAVFLVALPLTAIVAKVSDESVAPLKAQLANQSLDLLENQDVYLAYGWLEIRLAGLEKTDAKLRREQSKSAYSNGLGVAVVTLMSMLAVVLGAWFGANAVLSGVIPGASLAVFTLLPIAIFEILLAAQPAVSAYRKYRVSAMRVAELLDRDIPVALQIVNGDLELEGFKTLALEKATLRYPEAERVAFSDFDFTLTSGEVVLLSGESGSGKSSVALALARLIELDSGAYTINGYQASNFTVDSIRRRVGVVEQSPMIFLGDVRANLSLAKPEASDEELIQALTEVGLWEMFETRAGLGTQLGDRGVLISGGEAQRLGLARAILADFEVLILDEPTANVDEVAADQLIADLLAVAKGKANRAILLISHERRFRGLVDREVVMTS